MQDATYKCLLQELAAAFKIMIAMPGTDAVAPPKDCSLEKAVANANQKQVLKEQEAVAKAAHQQAVKGCRQQLRPLELNV